jgi:hypothetical protein
MIIFSLTFTKARRFLAPLVVISDYAMKKAGE